MQAFEMVPHKQAEIALLLDTHQRVQFILESGCIKMTDAVRVCDASVVQVQDLSLVTVIREFGTWE